MKPGRTKDHTRTDGRTEKGRAGRKTSKDIPKRKRNEKLTFITQRKPPQLWVIRKALHTYRRRCLDERYDALAWSGRASERIW